MTTESKVSCTHSLNNAGIFLFEEGEVQRWSAYTVYEPWKWIFCYTTTTAEKNRFLNSFLGLIIIMALVISILSGLITYFFSVRNNRPLNEMVERLKDIATGEGDLTKRIEVKSEDEIGELGRWLNMFAEKIQKIIQQVGSNVLTLSNASGDMASISEEMASEAEHASAQSTSLLSDAQNVQNRMGNVAPFIIIMIIASLGILAGVTFSGGMMEVARKGIFHPQFFTMPELIIFWE